MRPRTWLRNSGQFCLVGKLQGRQVATFGSGKQRLALGVCWEARFDKSIVRVHTAGSTRIVSHPRWEEMLILKSPQWR